MEKTLLVIKPDGVLRGLVGEIVGRFEKVGLKMIGMKMVRVTDDLLVQHYNKDEIWYKRVGEATLKFWEENGKDATDELGTTDPITIGKKVQGWLFDYVKSGPVVAIVLSGPHAVELVRKHVGPTYPIDAPPGTIRGDYHFDSLGQSASEKRAVYNMVHASGSVDEAEFEIKLWFREDEIYG